MVIMASVLILVLFYVLKVVRTSGHEAQAGAAHA
jgi:hypothetical protein